MGKYDSKTPVCPKHRLHTVGQFGCSMCNIQKREAMNEKKKEDIGKGLLNKLNEAAWAIFDWRDLYFKEFAEQFPGIKFKISDKLNSIRESWADLKEAVNEIDDYIYDEDGCANYISKENVIDILDSKRHPVREIASVHRHKLTKEFNEALKEIEEEIKNG